MIIDEHPDNIYLDLERPDDLRALSDPQTFFRLHRGMLLCSFFYSTHSGGEIDLILDMDRRESLLNSKLQGLQIFHQSLLLRLRRLVYRKPG